MNPTQNPLAVEVLKENLPEADAMALQSSFLPFFQEAQNLKAVAESIVVTDAEQTDLIAKAREMRLSLKRVRTSTENTRKELKAESLRRGKAIDGMANIIKFIIEPLEEHLEKQENFAALQMAGKIEAVKQERVKELAAFGVDAMLYTDLGTMPDDLYEKLKQGAKASFDLKREAEEKLKKEQEEKAKAEAAERERVRLENEALRKKNEEERVAREKAEKELRDRKEAEEKERKAKERKERAEKNAPDKKKLLNLAITIDNLILPEVTGDDAKKVLEDARTLLMKTTAFIRKHSEEL